MTQPDPIFSTNLNTTKSDGYAPDAASPSNLKKRIYTCDRCGGAMREKSCKVVCPNCGNRFDCSDLNIYFD